MQIANSSWCGLVRLTSGSGVMPNYRWLFWLLRSHEYSREELLRLFPELAIQRATVALSNICLITKDKQMYDLRKKAEIDYHWGLIAAKKEGREDGLEKGREEGRRDELIKIVAFCKSILELPETPIAELEKLDIKELGKIASDLQGQVRRRVT
jgi:flagellar biosynthesis/type III secretory pathway protein FliH